jgi:hypothetical protein
VRKQTRPSRRNAGRPTGTRALSANERPIGSGRATCAANPKKLKRHHVIVALNDEQMAATEGWRTAHGIADQSEALSELVRIGLLSEIAKIYRLVSDHRSTAQSRNGSGLNNHLPAAE